MTFFELELTNVDVANVGRLKFEKLYQVSKKRMEDILLGGNEWRQYFMRKLEDDMARDRTYGDLMEYGYRQGEGFQKVYDDLGNINYDNFE